MTGHRNRTTLLWIALSIVGLVIAVGGSYAASQLSKPRVGLASEPLSGVEQLAPAQRSQKPQRTQTTTQPTQPTQTQTTPPSQSDDHGEHGSHGHGGDD